MNTIELKISRKELQELMQADITKDDFLDTLLKKLIFGEKRTYPFTIMYYPARYEDKEMVSATLQVENTPDTEWKRQLRIDFEVAYGSMPKNFEHVPSVHISDWWLEKLSSRDTYWKERVRKEVEGMKKEHIPADNIWEGDEEEEVGEWKLVPKEDGMYCLNCKRFTPEEGCICGLISFEALDKLLDNLK